MNEMQTALKIVEIIPYLWRTLSREARLEVGAAQGRITLTHLRVLAHARRQPGCSLGELADAREVSLPTMSKMVSGMVDRGLLTREQDPSNRRVVRINLTSEGERLYLEILGRVQHRVAGLLHGVPPEQRDRIVETLECLANVFAPEGEIRQYLPLPIDDDVLANL